MDAEEALQRLLEHPSPEVAELTERLLQAVDGMHREPLGRLVELLRARGMLGEALEDAEVAALLEMYDLAPLAPEAQVERALEDVRPYIQSHGGQLDVLAVEGGTVRVRLAGSCSGCSGSALTLKRGVEAALRHGFPGFVAMEVEEAQPETARPTFIPLQDVRAAAPPVKPVFQDAAAVADVKGMLAVRVGAEEVLLHNLDGDVYAFRKGGDRVQAFPVAIEGGRVKVATNVPANAPVPGTVR